MFKVSINEKKLLLVLLNYLLVVLDIKFIKVCFRKYIKKDKTK